jgi:ribonuclease P protein subunit POP4
MELKDWIQSDEFLQNLSGRQFLLDTFMENKKVKEKKGPGRTLFDVPQEEIKFELYLPLHRLWNDYIEDLLAGNYSDNNIKNKVLKADMHGASLTVWKSTCKSYEGQKGIVLQETMKTFRVITKENSIKSKKNLVFLKENSVFLLEIAGKIVKLFGENFLYRPSLRSRVKWKQKDKLKMFK